MTKELSKIKHNYLVDEVLDAYRQEFYDQWSNSGLYKRDLDKDVSVFEQYSALFKEIPHPFEKKSKIQKVSNLGMAELTKIVLDLNKDVKQIKEAQSVLCA